MYVVGLMILFDIIRIATICLVIWLVYMNYNFYIALKEYYPTLYTDWGGFRFLRLLHFVPPQLRNDMIFSQLNREEQYRITKKNNVILGIALVPLLLIVLITSSMSNI